jgi:predicted RNA-binding Zn-ribbon protein involved in translation (DUF1610 family)
MDFTAKPTVVIFLCRKCGALFRANQLRAQDPSPSKFECSNCSTAVFQWAGEYDYADWRVEA